MPLFLRKFAADAVETAIGAILALPFVAPVAGLPTLDSLKQLGIACTIAIGSALVSAARRAAPGAIAWLKDKLGVTEDQ